MRNEEGQSTKNEGRIQEGVPVIVRASHFAMDTDRQRAREIMLKAEIQLTSQACASPRLSVCDAFSLREKERDHEDWRETDT